MADVSDIFYFLFCFGGGARDEESETKRGGYFYLEIERGGAVFLRRGGRVVHTGAGRVSRGGGG